MNSILDKIAKNKVITNYLNNEGKFVALDINSLAYLIASAFSKKAAKTLVIVPNLYNAQDLYDKLSLLLGEEAVLFFPRDEVLRVNQAVVSKQLLAQRLYVMEEALSSKKRILIAHVTATTRFLPDKKLFLKHSFHFHKGDLIDIDKLEKNLIEDGYTKVNKIDQSLQFARRGEILDIFSVNLEQPIRIEFFDDEIESIRTFSIETQRSSEEIVEAHIFPSNELFVTKEQFEMGKTLIEAEVKNKQKELDHESGELLLKSITNDLYDIKENGFSENTYKYYSYFVSQPSSIIDYFNPEETVIYDIKRCRDVYSFTLEESFEFYEELSQRGYTLRNIRLNLDFDKILNDCSNKIFIESQFSSINDQALRMRPIPFGGGSILKSFELIDKFQIDGNKVVVALNDSQFDTFLDYLDDYQKEYEIIEPNQTPKRNLGVTKMKLEEGFELIDEKICYLSAREIFGYRNHLTRFMHRYKEAKILNSYEDLKIGDYVVHEENGIGQFDSIVNLEVGGIKKDFLKIRYQKKEVLYVPLEQFKLVRKFVSKEGAVPKLNHLGGNEWKKTKEKIKERVNMMAERLIELYANRESIKGISFNSDDEMQKEFERAFPYPLTIDQEKAIAEIKADMEKDTPMDRLLCGDVGFGKTEVAFRAAFKAILSGKQVALLCPTTILARQHYERAIERFALFGVRIALFSRFVSESNQKKYIKDIEEKKIDLIIGTHRLLSKEIKIPSLGLLIVDEEQRFGVEHKERIKEIANHIDVLTLTATPIPRTLQMSLLGIRSVSTLNSAPINRMPIQTYVMPYSKGLIREVIERELARQGQVFYLHNQVNNIFQVARTLQSQIKNAQVAVVNGQMDREIIEETMNRVYNGEVNLLVCTSIIETGIDIPNANTIIVENADTFGLSQLYQIKGRVGRSNRIAYAYLVYNEHKELNDKAKKRLQAIKEFAELGSGYKIAQCDLTIRGAGDILGSEQSGFIETVGIDMYIRLLNEVIEERKGIKKEKTETKITNVTIEGFIPKEYAEDGDKLELYQEIQEIHSLPQLILYRAKIRDIYGRLPQEVESLLRKRRIDILSSGPGIEQVKEEGNIIYIDLTSKASSISKLGVTLFKELDRTAQNVRGVYQDRKIKLRLKKTPSYLDDLEKILETINKLVK